jgi:hypothetical protein
MGDDEEKVEVRPLGHDHRLDLGDIAAEGFAKMGARPVELSELPTELAAQIEHSRAHPENLRARDTTRRRRG